MNNFNDIMNTKRFKWIVSTISDSLR